MKFRVSQQLHDDVLALIVRLAPDFTLAEVARRAVRKYRRLHPVVNREIKRSTTYKGTVIEVVWNELAPVSETEARTAMQWYVDVHRDLPGESPVHLDSSRPLPRDLNVMAQQLGVSVGGYDERMEW